MLSSDEFTEEMANEFLKAIETLKARSAEIKERTIKHVNNPIKIETLTPVQEIKNVLKEKKYKSNMTKHPRKKDKVLTDYLVYAAKHDDEIVYIGSGVNGRERHCISGCSHVYELNKLHFNNKNISVTVMERFETKDESLAREKVLIEKYKPRYNVKDNTHENIFFQYRILEKWDDYFKTVNSEYYKSNVLLMKELVARFKFAELISDSGVKSTGIRSDLSPELKTHQIYTMLSCIKGITVRNKALEQASNLFCTIEGRIKIPIEPPEY